jgi:bacterioferritin
MAAPLKETKMFEQSLVPKNMFLDEVESLRQAARAVMQTPPSGTAASIALLQTVLSTEIVCVMRYTMMSVSADGLKNDWIGKEFQAQANDERRHMAQAAARIAELGGTPDFSASQVGPRLARDDGHTDLAIRVRENLAAEQSVIAHYHELIAFLAPRDPRSCEILGAIVQDEEDHTSDMEDLLVSYAG